MDDVHLDRTSFIHRIFLKIESSLSGISKKITTGKTYQIVGQCNLLQQ